MENIPCKQCGNLTMPLHIDYKCPNCSIYSKMTEEQTKAYEQLKTRWFKVSEPTIPWPRDPYVWVRVEAENGYGMFLGIEPDGYTHS